MKTTTLFTLGALGTLAAAMATPAHAEEKKEERRIVIKVDGKDMSIPEAASHAIDKAMAALDSALAVGTAFKVSRVQQEPVVLLEPSLVVLNSQKPLGLARG